MTDLTVHIPTAVDAALALRKEHTKNKKLLDDDARVFIQVALHKTPVVEEPRRVYVYLDHCHAGNDPDVCIFTRNGWPNDHIVRTPNDKIEFSIDYYEKVLKEHKIESISSIMPLKQLRNEYGPYELRRKLCNRFDLFVTDTTLLKRLKFTQSLGKIFTKANKYPVGVKFPKPDQHDDNFKNRIEKALKTAYFSIKPGSNNYSIPVGLTSQTKKQLTENATQIIKQIVTRSIIPGGFGNVKSIYIKTDKSKAIPLYISLESKNNVPVPYVKSKIPKSEPVEGEISTRPGMKVIVMPDGDVIIKKSDEDGSDLSGVSDEEEDEEDEMEEFDDSDADEPVKKESKNKKEKEKNVAKDEESEDEDETAENAEQKYLSDWLDEINEEEEKIKEDEGKQKGSKKGKKRKADDSPATPEKKIKSSDGQGRKNEKKFGKNKREAPQKNSGRNENKQKESPKLEKKGKRKNISGKQKKPSQLGKNKKSIVVEKNKKRKQKQ